MAIILSTELDPEALRKDAEERPEHPDEVSAKAVLYWRRRLEAKTQQESGLFEQIRGLKQENEQLRSELFELRRKLVN